MSEERLRRKTRRRARRRNRQWRLYQETGDRRHLVYFRRHRKAVRYMRRLLLWLARQERPSFNFDYSEFDCRDRTPVPKASYPALDQLCQDYLEPLRKEFGPVFITSGYRHETYNANVGGVSNSIHIYDLPGREPDAVAADVICERGTPEQWANFLERLNPGGLGVYPTLNFDHVDNRQRIGWPTPARWRG